MLIILFTLCTVSINLINTAAIYDQSQTGKLNVQVDLKDLNFFAILKGDKKEEYVDYDYAYDYSEMTIKPHGHKSTTAKPENGTISTTTASNNVSQETQQNTTLKLETTTEAIKTTTINGSEAITIPLNTSVTSVNENARPTTSEGFMVNSTNASTSALEITTKPTNSTGCKKGFGVNQKGECEMRLQGTGNALLKLVKLSQKLKLRRENKRN